MKKNSVSIIFFLLFFTAKAQSFSISVDGINYSISKTEKDGNVNAEYRMNWIQIGAALPSKNKLGRYCSFGIYIYGKTVGTYSVGCCDKNNYNEPYENSISANWFDNTGLEHNKKANQGDVENNYGKITLTKVDSNIVSGTFYCTISGTKIQGTFDNIPVKSWPSN